MMTPEAMTTEQIQTAWDDIAAGYDEFTTSVNMPLGEEALRRVGLQAGMQFLDVAAGTGALSLTAARLGAQVLATDISSTMVDRLNARAREEGLSNLEARVMDGHNLDLEDDTFDVSGSQFGVMLFPDLPRGLRELARVTKPGGRVLIAAFGPPTKAEFSASSWPPCRPPFLASRAFRWIPLLCLSRWQTPRSCAGKWPKPG